MGVREWMDEVTAQLLFNPKTSFLQQVFANYLTYMPGIIPRDRDPTMNKADNADAVKRLHPS